MAGYPPPYYNPYQTPGYPPAYVPGYPPGYPPAPIPGYPYVPPPAVYPPTPVYPPPPTYPTGFAYPPLPAPADYCPGQCYPEQAPDCPSAVQSVGSFMSGMLGGFSSIARANHSMVHQSMHASRHLAVCGSLNYITREEELTSCSQIKLISSSNGRALRVTWTGNVDCLGDPNSPETTFVVNRMGLKHVTLNNAATCRYLSISNANVTTTACPTGDCHLTLDCSFGAFSIGGIGRSYIKVSPTGQTVATPFKLSNEAKFKVSMC